MAAIQENRTTPVLIETGYRDENFVVARFDQLEDLPETRQVAYPLRKLIDTHANGFLEFLDSHAKIIVIKPPRRYVKPDFPSTNLHGLVLSTEPTIEKVETGDHFPWDTPNSFSFKSVLHFSAERFKEKYIQTSLSIQGSSFPNHPSYSLHGDTVHHSPKGIWCGYMGATSIYDLEGKTHSPFSFSLRTEPHNPFFVKMSHEVFDEFPLENYFHQLFIADFGHTSEKI